MSPARILLKTAAWFFAGILGAAAAPAPSTFSWEVAERVVTSHPGQETVSVVFPFRNATDHTLRIMTINSSCTCTTATTAKDAYAPGEKGDLQVEFQLGERMGRQERVITVVTDDPNSPLSSVKLIVDIPELASVRPRLLFWSIGEKAETKVAEIVLANPETSRIELPESTDPAFSAKILPAGKAGVYRLEVTPRSTAESSHAAIHLTATVQGTKQNLAIFAAVK
jgi:hypothetical protein